MSGRQLCVGGLKNLFLRKCLPWFLTLVAANFIYQTAIAGMVQVVPQKVYLANNIGYFPSLEQAANITVAASCNGTGVHSCRDLVNTEYSTGPDQSWPPPDHFWATSFTFTDENGVDHIGNINGSPGSFHGLIGWECPEAGVGRYPSASCGSSNGASSLQYKNTGGHVAENCLCKDQIPMAGNPINVGTGNKFQLETDYSGTGPFPLSFKRAYNSANNNISVLTARNIGKGWRHSYDRAVYISSYGTASTATITRPEGYAVFFSLVNGIWTSDSDVSDKFIALTDSSGNSTGWQYTIAQNDNVETYNAAGLLTSIANRNGLTQTLSYSGNVLTRVADNWGRQLNFSYDTAGMVHTVTDPAGGVITYSYQWISGESYVSTVTYQDGRAKSYLFGETGYPWSLTGINDENGTRFATFSYDNLGKAISTEHAGGVEKYYVSPAYVDAGKSIGTVIDPLGATHTYNFKAVLGVVKSTGQSRTASSGSDAATTVLTYDANGNVVNRTDFNGTVTTYSYDLTRNLETSRVEASGTPQAKTITTAWHSTYNLPQQIAEPKLLTTYVYDTSGNLLSKTVQATSDATGAQDLSPTLIGAARTWSYTYNNVGQVLTATGPRTDVADKTTYTYDSSGNLSTITNAVGQVTTLSNYDANGRVGLITDANGATTALTYSPRGWLTGKTVTANGTVETTTYSYDGVGQLTLVTLPNASTVSYTYDPAHRLTNIADSLGNSIAYTLDNMGNRISEQVKDPSGALARQTSRVMDALNRLQQITGSGS